MIRKIEVDFALPVELTDDECRQLCNFVQRVAKRHEPADMVHWQSGVGDKPIFSIADCHFLGLKPEPGVPESGEPTYDEEVFHISTSAREAYPEELERKKREPVEDSSSPRPVKKELPEHDDNLPGMSNREIQARFGLILTKEQAERDFLEASIAVWREIDRLMIVGPYPGIPMAADLRIMEKLAWERYRSFLEPAGDSSSPQDQKK